MTDFKLLFEPNRTDMYSDISWAGTTFEEHDGFEVAVMLSHFCDAPVTEDEALTPGDLRGFWGDDVLGYTLGSKLWLLDRAKITQETLVLAKQYSEECMQWAIDQDIMSSVEAEALKIGTNRIRITNVMKTPKGDINEFAFSTMWKAQLGIT